MKRKTCKVIFSAAAALLVISAAVFGGGALAARRARRRAPKIPENATLTPETVARPGDAALAELEFALPWGVAVTEATAETGEDAAVSGPVKIGSKWRWGRNIWRVEAAVRPLGSRGSAPGKLHIVLDRPLPGVGNKELSITIPSVKVTGENTPGAAEPRFADAEPPKRRSAKWYCHALGGALFAAIVAVLARLLLRRRRSAAAPMPWDTARAELEALREAMAESAFSTGSLVAELSDILRKYLASRFDLPAATEPGCRFLDTPAAVGHLTEDERAFLHGFFAAAEPVMFARFPADRSELERAVAAAAALVERTVPPPPERKREKNAREARS
jgi:hypothetical protein